MASNTLSALLRRSHIDDHEEVLKAADAALKLSKTDVDAQHVKIVALLKLDRYDEAVKILASASDKLKERVTLEHAYALYKSGQAKEAAQVARSGSGRGNSHVEAQASYRSEDFGRAAELYKDLLQSHGGPSNEIVDLRINSSAVDAQLEWIGQGHLARSRKAGRKDLEAFETAYNAACGSIARGELAQAEILLKRSRDLCDALDDLSDDDKHAELLPIAVQQIYVLLRLGKSEQARQLSESIIAKEVQDSTTKQIARINTLVTQDGKNPFILQRLATSSTHSGQADRPFAFQASALKQNDNAIALSTQKLQGRVRAAKAASKSEQAIAVGSARGGVAALGAAAQARTASAKQALKLLIPELAQRPEDIGLILTVIQLHVSSGNYDSATLLMEKSLQRLEAPTEARNADTRYAPGLVGTVVSLYTARGQVSHARRELANASAHWRRLPRNETMIQPVALRNLHMAAAGTLVDSALSADKSEVKEILEALQGQSSNGYVQAVVTASSSDSQKHQSGDSAAHSTSIDPLIGGIDVDALEAAGIARVAHARTASSATKRPAETSDAPKKKRKVKPSKQPKDFDPSKTPDPERWLPLRDRSTYKPKGKKGKQRANMLAQGAVDDIARPSTPQTEVVKGAGGAGAGGKGQAKKKKGKGGKW